MRFYGETNEAREETHAERGKEKKPLPDNAVKTMASKFRDNSLGYCPRRSN